MVAEDSESNFGTTVRAFAFNGDETKFRSWEGKTLALAASKGFLLALTKPEARPGLTVEEYEYGEVEEPVMQPTGVPAGGTGVVGVLQRAELRPRWRTVSTWRVPLRGHTWLPVAPIKHTL